MTTTATPSQTTGTSQRQFVKAMRDGDSIDDVYLVSDKQLRANRNGNFYLQLELHDRTGTISARLWNASENLFKTFEVGDFLKVKGKVQLFQGALQMILSHIDRVSSDDVPLAEFLPQTEHDVSKLLARARQLLMSVTNMHLRALVETFFIDEALMNDFCRAPAGVRNHHAYLGGLLEHVVKLLELGDRVAPLYPELDRDLLMVGIFLHDIGKVRELSFDRAFAYTDEGQLIGHLVQGVELLNDKIARVPDLTGEPMPIELVLRLKHMIVSHHGTLEFGSPRLPMTPEAIALHFLDNFDAKVHSFHREITADRNSTSAWTPFNPSLQRRLFKGGTSGDSTNHDNGSDS